MVLPIVFRYSRPFAVAGLLGVPVIAALSASMIVAATWVLAHLSPGLEDAFSVLFFYLLGSAFAWVLVVALRGWHSLLGAYVVGEAGVDAYLFSSHTFMSWEKLKTAHYRKAFGQLELTFQDAARRVVLTNVDRTWERPSVNAAMQVLKRRTPIDIRVTLL